MKAKNFILHPSALILFPSKVLEIFRCLIQKIRNRSAEYKPEVNTPHSPENKRSLMSL